MPAVPVPMTALLFAAAFGLVNLWLSVRAIVVRRRTGALLGDEGARLLQARMRAQANFAEYVPLALVLMALIELAGGRATPLYAIGSLLLVGRILHPFGMERPGANAFRAAGIMLTFGCTAALIGWAAWILLHPAARAAAA